MLLKSNRRWDIAFYFIPPKSMSHNIVCANDVVLILGHHENEFISWTLFTDYVCLLLELTVFHQKIPCILWQFYDVVVSVLH